MKTILALAMLAGITVMSTAANANPAAPILTPRNFTPIPVGTFCTTRCFGSGISRYCTTTCN